MATRVRREGALSEDQAEAWFLAARAWSAAALAPKDVRRAKKLLERAFRAHQKASVLDPDRAEREKNELMQDAERARKRSGKERA